MVLVTKVQLEFLKIIAINVILRFKDFTNENNL